jgi:hypothetical protein
MLDVYSFCRGVAVVFVDPRFTGLRQLITLWESVRRYIPSVTNAVWAQIVANRLLLVNDL